MVNDLKRVGMAILEHIPVQEIKAAEETEVLLSVDLGFSKNQGLEELQREIERKTERETELLQHCFKLQNEKTEWKRMCGEARETCRAVEKEREEMNAELTSLKTLLAGKAKQGDEANMALAEKLQKRESQILALQSRLAALEEDQQKAWEDPSHHQNKKFIFDLARLVLGIRKELHDLMDKVQEFQVQCGGKSPSCKLGSCKHGSDKVPDLGSLGACGNELSRVIACARSGLTEATKARKNAERRVELLRGQAIKCLLHAMKGKTFTVDDTKILDTPIDFRIPPHPMERQLWKKHKGL